MKQRSPARIGRGFPAFAGTLAHHHTEPFGDRLERTFMRGRPAFNVFVGPDIPAREQYRDSLLAAACSSSHDHIKERREYSTLTP